MICGVRLLSNGAEGFVYASFDGGRTWRETLTDRSSAWTGEASCALGTDNTAYFVAGASNTDIGTQRHEYGRTYLYSSSDAGRTWHSPSVYPFLDFTSATVDHTEGPNRGRVYVVANNASDGLGHWIDARPAMFTSKDGGRTTGEPLYPPTPKDFLRSSAFPMDTIVLDSQTIVSLFLGGRSEGRGFIRPDESGPKNDKDFPELLRSTDGGATLANPLLLDTRPVRLQLSLAYDRKNGMLYAAWVRENQGRSQIVVARSGDKGISWQLNVAVEGDREEKTIASFSQIAIAANSGGVLGLTWGGAGGSCARFAISSNQGQTFTAPFDLSPCGSAVRLTKDVYADFVTSVPRFESRIGRGDIQSQGLSIRLGASGRANVFAQLLTDRFGRFHPIWTDRLTQVWTRTVSVDHATQMAEGLTELEDVSKLVHLKLTNNRFFSDSSRFYVDLAVMNTSASRICGPISIIAGGVRSDYGNVEVENADNGALGEGARWEIPDLGDRAVLGPMDTTRPRTLGFQIKNLVELDRGDLVALPLKAFGKTGAACESSGEPRNK